MRIAHLILTHANSDQLKRLINSLKHADADFYIHVDLKAAIIDFLSLADIENVFFIKRRVRVTWGSYSILQATINSYSEILNSNKKYDYINLLSAQDYPLKSTEEIHLFFKNNAGKAFMETLSVENVWQEAIPRLTKYHLTDYSFFGKNKVENFLNKILPERKMPNGLIAVGRSQWITITPTHAAYIIEYLKKNPNVKRFFKLTWGSDEIMFQTILFNSQYKDDIVYDNLRFIDWSEGKASPKTFTIQDLSTLINSGKLFARKFNASIDEKVLNELDKHRAK